MEQPYYNWMTAAAFARPDLVMAIPGNAFLEHGGAVRDWPTDAQGRYLPEYANNTFAGHKSYHVVGEVNDFFGGYYRDDDYGFGHWARHDEMPGQKLWLWALSREGGIWEDLLTDTDGQYIEFQAGRLLVQYAPGSDINPITQVGFDPGTTDRWSETWFPVEGLGGLTDASRDGAMFVERDGDRVTIRINAFGNLADTLRVFSGDEAVYDEAMTIPALEPIERIVPVSENRSFRIEMPTLDLRYDSDPRTREIARPFSTSPDARVAIPQADRWVFEARELIKGRRYAAARQLLDSALAEEPWHRDALLARADVEYRRGRYEGGLGYAHSALQLDAYDADANFVAGNLYRALYRGTDAHDAFS